MAAGLPLISTILGMLVWSVTKDSELVVYREFLNSMITVRGDMRSLHTANRQSAVCIMFAIWMCSGTVSYFFIDKS